MTIERARVSAQAKPWGVADLRPWSDIGDGTALIGELSFERESVSAPAASLLLKLLFTSAPLSIQVHPDDAYANSIGLPNGKSEAWHVLSAAPGAMVALGLKQPTTREQLRQSIVDGSIERLADWQPVKARDTIDVPAGTIHAIGAGVVIAEIQQRSDATFRLFDHGRERSLHVDHGIAVAAVGSAPRQPRTEQLSPERSLLASNAHFVFERIALGPDTTWRLDLLRETWLLIIDGSVATGSLDLSRGEAIFAQAQDVDVRVGQDGVEFLVAYAGASGPVPRLVQQTMQQDTTVRRPTGKDVVPALANEAGT